MGNVAEVFHDISESDGNNWHEDKIQLPNPADVLGSEPSRPRPLRVPARRESVIQTHAGLCHLNLNPQQPSPRTSFADFPMPSQAVLTAVADSNDLVGRGSCRWRWKAWTSNGSLLSEVRLLELRPHLPLSSRVASCWKLLYSPRVHGISLQTFFRHCEACPGETVLLVEDSGGTVFGGFASHTWTAGQQQLHFGHHDCFVFSFGSSKEEDDVRVHTWAGGDLQFLHASVNGLIFGGGRPPALWIDRDFMFGESAPCETFGTAAPLASSSAFVIRRLELWGFGSSSPSFEDVDPGPREASATLEFRTRLREEAASARAFNYR